MELAGHRALAEFLLDTPAGRAVAMRIANPALYLALAEVLDSTLLTCDGRLARASGMARCVELVVPSV